MADNGSQPGTSAGSGNINTAISGSHIGIFNQHNHLTASTSTSPTNIVIDYCPASVSTFLGRSKELGTLKTLLTRHHVVALVGMGGLGKTQLSRKYVQVNKADYKYKYWLESETPEKLENSFKELANMLDIKSANINKVVNDVYMKIQAVPTILIFDNVEKPADVYAYLPTRVDLPPGVTIHVLVTSRWAEWTCDEQIQCYKLQPLDISASLQIFQRKLGETCIDTMKNEWKELAEMLGYLPLALQVAASYIHKRYKHNSDLHMVLDDYMKQLRKGAEKLLNDRLTEYDNGSVYTSMLLTLKQLENETDDEWKFAVTLINATAYMNPDRIKKKCLLKLLDNEDNPCILDEALVILADYSLFNQGEDWFGLKCYTVHRVIQTSIRHNQTVKGTVDLYYTGLLKYVLSGDYQDVLQYANERVSAVVNYFKENPSSLLLIYLIHCKAITAVQAVLKLMSGNLIQSQIQQHDLLYRAVYVGDLSMAQLLRHNGADINQRCLKAHEPPLHLAVRRGDMEIATWLLQNGAAPTQRDWLGRNALHVAIMHANYKMVPVIVKIDRAAVNETDILGKTPLLSIDNSDSEEGILSTIRILAESGADITAVDKRGNTALHSVARGARAAAVALILQLNKDLINIVNEKGKTALHVISYTNMYIDYECITSTIRVLVESGADLAKVDIQGNTVLHFAARNACTPAIALILQLNKDLINIANKYGQTALHVIPYNNTRTNIVMLFDENSILYTMRVLVKSDVDLAKVDVEGNTALHSAALGARAGAVSLLLQLNKDLINIVNKAGETALHALSNGLYDKSEYKSEEERRNLFERMKEIARALIMNGLSLHTRDNKGCTPLDTVPPEFKDMLLQVAYECNNQ